MVTSASIRSCGSGHIKIAKSPNGLFCAQHGESILLHALNDGAAIKNNGSVIFAAPDVAQDIFSDALSKIWSAGKIKELYASDSDWALSFSRYVNSPHDRYIARAGNGGDNILILPGLETVDATRLSSIWSGYGHSYVFENKRAIHDIDQILNLGRKADERGLERREKNGATFWMFGP
jgi:esterase/lipase superfamily enzyme